MCIEHEIKAMAAEYLKSAKTDFDSVKELMVGLKKAGVFVVRRANRAEEPGSTVLIEEADPDEPVGVCPEEQEEDIACDPEPQCQPAPHPPEPSAAELERRIADLDQQLSSVEVELARMDGMPGVESDSSTSGPPRLMRVE